MDGPLEKDEALIRIEDQETHVVCEDIKGSNIREKIRQCIVSCLNTFWRIIFLWQCNLRKYIPILFSSWTTYCWRISKRTALSNHSCSAERLNCIKAMCRKAVGNFPSSWSLMYPNPFAYDKTLLFLLSLIMFFICT